MSGQGRHLRWVGRGHGRARLGMAASTSVGGAPEMRVGVTGVGVETARES